MKYYFILNPVSGNRQRGYEILKKIRDAYKFVKEKCEEWEKIGNGETLRLYGVGGDGTVNELVNGAYGYNNVELGVIPQGTGNDYIRNYGDGSHFLNIEEQIAGSSKYSDLIKYKAEYEGKISEGYCANMFNIGFDCNVVDMTDTVKNWPMCRGSLAYLLSVFIVLVKKKEIALKVEYGLGINGEELGSEGIVFSGGEHGTVRDGKVLLISIANGCFCGGGIKGVPNSILDDGLMDVSLVKGGVSRSQFIRLFPKYQKGVHLGMKECDEIIEYRQEKALRVTAKGEFLRLCVDGEITSQKKVEFEIVPKAIKFIVPKGLQI